MASMYTFSKAALWWPGIILVYLLGVGVTYADAPTMETELQVLAWLSAMRSKSSDRLFLIVTMAGSNIVLLPLALLAVVKLVRGRMIRAAMFLSSATMGASLLANVGKHLIARPRPTAFPLVSDLPSGFSFPSGHASQITAFVLAALLLLRNNPLLARWFAPCAWTGGAFIAVVALSRLYLQVHYPSDVLAGILLGLCWVMGLTGTLPPSSCAFDVATKHHEK
jgi:undecaprenyl-diphosphatase